MERNPGGEGGKANQRGSRINKARERRAGPVPISPLTSPRAQQNQAGPSDRYFKEFLGSPSSSKTNLERRWILSSNGVIARGCSTGFNCIFSVWLGQRPRRCLIGGGAFPTGKSLGRGEGVTGGCYSRFTRAVPPQRCLGCSDPPRCSPIDAGAALPRDAEESEKERKNWGGHGERVRARAGRDVSSSASPRSSAGSRASGSGVCTALVPRKGERNPIIGRSGVERLLITGVMFN